MADTGAPFEIPYVEPTDLVRTYPAASELLADAIADQFGLGYQYVGTRYYTSSGTFAKADPFGDSSFDGTKMRAIRVRMVGAGGGGGGCATTGVGQAAVAQSGGGAAYAESFITDIASLDASVTVTRGGGGAGGAAGLNNGSAGGTSSFGALVTAAGGGAGLGSTAETPSLTLAFTNPPASGATTATGDLVISGSGSSVGYLFSAFSTVPSATPGSSHLSGALRPNLTASGEDGAVGVSFGGGGRGGVNAASQATARAGGAGGNGIVIVDVFA